MRLALVVAIVVAITVARASAHVAPAIEDNNRHLKLTPLGDRVRLAYTVFFGERPGAVRRRAIDANHDAMIDEAESQAFGARLAGELAAALDVTIDGARQPVVWSQIVVGMGTPETAAGGFSIDLVAALCLAPPRGKHAIQLRDRYALDHPGETEVTVEDSPGVTIDRARIGATADPSYAWKLVGNGGPLADDGLELRFTTRDAAAVGGDAACRAASPDRGRSVAAITATAAGAAIALAGLIAWVVRRLRRA
jgi:hypothetical protein